MTNKTMIDNNNIEHHHHHHAASHGDLIRIITASVLYIAANLVSDMIADPMHRLALYIIVYLFVGIDVIWNAIKGIVHGEWFDENFLMTVATLGVFALAIFEGNDDYGEAISVILFFRIGEYFQGYASMKSKKKIEALGIEKSGSSRSTSQSEAFITRFAKVYTPFVCCGALILAIIAPLINMAIGGGDANWNTWIYRALTFLVISCPCALVISIPMTFFASIINASKHGILITDGCGLEQLNKGTFPSGEIVFADNNPSKHNIAKKIARRCMNIVWQNIFFAIGVKIIVLILSAFGITSMWLAIFADTGIMILAVLNAMRALYIKSN
ncbi:MAG: hypothetical protein U0L19_08155 [Bacteroidales bacterium]|nr:hypothetical protein [Bacteroidales bacterium]